MPLPDIDVLILEPPEGPSKLESLLRSEIAGINITTGSSIKQLHKVISTSRVKLLLLDALSESSHPSRVCHFENSAFRTESFMGISFEDVLSILESNSTDYIYHYEITLEDLPAMVKNSLTHRCNPHQVSVYRVVQTNMRGIIGNSLSMKMMVSMLRKVADTQRPVLIQGPSGSGKDLVARAIHRLSVFSDGPFLDVNCGALPESLIESLLFGYEKGTFTGADHKRKGYLEASDYGTLFLDEIAELPLATQAKLLHVIESGTYRVLGENSSRQFRGRIVAATHANLEERILNRTFREDLYFRLNVFTLEVPPLNHRRDDIPSLVNYFSKDQQRPVYFTRKAMSALIGADWQGNVRELRNVIDRVAVLSDEEPVSYSTVTKYLGAQRAPEQDDLEALAGSILRLGVDDKLKAVENVMIARALRETQGNKSAAARLLGVHRKVIERRMRELEYGN